MKTLIKVTCLAPTGEEMVPRGGEGQRFFEDSGTLRHLTRFP